MSKPTKFEREVATKVVPWHKEQLPQPLSEKRLAKEHIFIGGKAASQELWSALVSLLETADGKSRVTRNEVAKSCGVSDSLIHRWLSGPSNMGIETAGKLAAAMRADITISAIPWEENSVQPSVHSYSTSRCIDVSAKHMAAKSVDAETKMIDDHARMMTMFISPKRNTYLSGHLIYTTSPQRKKTIEIKEDE